MRKLIIAAAVGVLAVIAIVWSAVHARHSKIEGRGEATHSSAPHLAARRDGQARQQSASRILGPSVLTPGIRRHDRPPSAAS
jgi:hypothetical protein